MELVLPNNYVEIQEEEMMYLDGGWSGATLGENLMGIYNWTTRQSSGLTYSLRQIGFWSVAYNLAYAAAPVSMYKISLAISAAIGKIAAVLPWVGAAAIGVLILGGVVLGNGRYFY